MGEEYKRRVALLQSGSGSGLKSVAVPPALLLAAAWYLSYSQFNRSQNANKEDLFSSTNCKT